MGSTQSVPFCSSACCADSKAADADFVSIKPVQQAAPTSGPPLSSKASGATASLRSRNITVEAAYPVYCLPMAVFLSLDRMQTHEVLFDDLVNPTDKTVVHFCSHEWLGFKHPDPDGVQISMLKVVFQKFINGQAKALFPKDEWDAFLLGLSPSTGKGLKDVEVSMFQRETFHEKHLPKHIANGCVWLDYHSIPQDKDRNPSSFLAAVNSIPHYVERCDYFWIIAPPATHYELRETRNFYTWRGRGWCRLEEVTNLLSQTLKMPLVVASENKVCTYGFLDGLTYVGLDPKKGVGHGQFTCCRFHHRTQLPDGSYKEIPCDREAIAPVLTKVFDSLYHHGLGGEGDRFKRSLLRLFGPSILSGFPGACTCHTAPEDETLENFLQGYGFSSLGDVDSLGFPPITWAMHAAPAKIVEAIIAERPDMLQTCPEHDVAPIGHAVSRPPAEFKQIVALCKEAASPPQVDHLSLAGYSAVDRAAKQGFHENLQTLLEMKAAIEPRRKHNGCTPLLSAAENGFDRCCEVLLQFRANLEAVDNFGQTALHYAAQPLAVLGNGDPEGKLKVLQVLLSARANTKRFDAQGRTPLLVAAENNFHAATQLLSGAEGKARPL